MKFKSDQLNKLRLQHKKAQSLSIDVVIVIALLLFGVLFLVFNQINTEEIQNFEETIEQSEIVSDTVFSSLETRGIVEDKAVNVERLIQLDEQELREELGVLEDFAIAFEKDGKLIYIDSTTNLSCLGTNKIIVNGNNCGFR